MEKVYSLKKNQDFRKVYNYSCSFANKYLVAYFLKNQIQENRIGISVSKKVGNSVVRHRLKRLVKESYRLNQKNLKKGFDIVIVVRVNAKEKKYKDIESSLLHLFQLKNLIK